MNGSLSPFADLLGRLTDRSDVAALLIAGVLGYVIDVAFLPGDPDSATVGVLSGFAAVGVNTVIKSWRDKNAYEAELRRAQAARDRLRRSVEELCQLIEAELVDTARRDRERRSLQLEPGDAFRRVEAGLIAEHRKLASLSALDSRGLASDEELMSALNAVLGSLVELSARDDPQARRILDAFRAADADEGARANG